MYAYIARRFALALVTLLGVCIITFLLVRVTGDPASFVLGEFAPDEAYEEFNARYGLDQPLSVQFLSFLGGILRGDLGVSIRYNEPVWEMFTERLPATIQLGASAYLVAILVGIPAGIYSGVRVGSFGDKLLRLLVIFGQAIPGFYLGLVLIVTMAVGLRLFPTGGRDGFASLVLPTITLSAYLTAVIVRFTRSVILDVLPQDFIRTARAKGLAESVVLWRHAFRNALIPLITIVGIQSKVVFTGAVVTETVFSWPGIGRLAVQAISTRDFPVVQGSVFVMTAMVVLLNLLVDIAYGYIDPRVRLE